MRRQKHCTICERQCIAGKLDAAIRNEEHRHCSRETVRTGEVQSKMLQSPTKGTCSSQCPCKPSLFCESVDMRLKSEESLGIYYLSTVGGKVVNDILLDTGASKTLVKEELVDRDCMYRWYHYVVHMVI